MERRAKPKRRNWHFARALLLLALWWVWLAGAAGSTCRLRLTPNQDQAAPADAIGVFGAAEYDGRPSPVYRARLDHALELYHRGIAPLIITLGGNGGDQYNEGAVGREYLMGMGVPEASHHCRDREPQHRGIGAPHRGDCPRQRTAAAGDRQRRNASVPDSRNLRRRRAGRADLAAAAWFPSRAAPGRSRAHRSRDSQLHGVADAFALTRNLSLSPTQAALPSVPGQTLRRRRWTGS